MVTTITILLGKIYEWNDIMLSNLVVLDPDFVRGDGTPKEFAEIHEHHNLAHPNFKEIILEGMMQVGNRPIFISKKEYEIMLKFQGKLRGTNIPIAERGEYQKWWGNFGSCQKGDSFI